MTAIPVPANGTVHTLAAHGYQAQIATVGASLASLQYQGRDLVVPFDPEVGRPRYRGVTLAPWPNRVVDGRYRFAGIDHHLALNETARGQALHGLVTWSTFEDSSIEGDRVVLRTLIEAQSGYPFDVEVQVEYHLDQDGLTQRVTGRNLGTTTAPWGTGPHPYLCAGNGSLDDGILHLPADQVLTVTPERMNPVALEPVQDHPHWDFRAPRPLGSTAIDHAFTGLTRVEGLATVTLRDSDGVGVAMSWDGACPWVQIHTDDGSDDEYQPRSGLAVEPMTCAPDAFNADRYDFDTGLILIDPGQRSTASWRVSALTG